MKNKLLRTVFLAALLTFTPGICSQMTESRAEDTFQGITLIGEWRQDEKGWTFALSYTDVRPASTWGYQYDAHYYFDSDGYMATGWRQIDGSWYYLDPEPGKWQGSRKTGWLYDNNYNGWFYLNRHGIMVTGWHKISGGWYYFSEKSDGAMGLMASDSMIDGWYVDHTGRMNES